MTTTDRLVALHEAVQRAREHRPALEVVSRLLARYRGTSRDFWLDWDPDAHGYRRRFEPVGSRVVWNEARLYSAAEVQQRIASREWTRIP